MAFSLGGRIMRSANDSLYERIYNLVRSIPMGRVSTYGRIAAAVGRCGPRNVGYAMAVLPVETDVPWHRVVNHKGEISLRRFGDGAPIQRQLLEAEGILFDDQGRIAPGLSCPSPPMTNHHSGKEGWSPNFVPTCTSFADLRTHLITSSLPPMDHVGALLLTR